MVWNVPHSRNPHFTGREEILAQLHARFKANNATALSQRHAMSGLGGIGKTQIAVEYAYRYHQEYQAVLWTRAESHEALISSFVEIARLLDLSQKEEQDQTITVQAVKRWLQDNNEWLLILDNADEPKVVREFLPTKCAGHILLTTRVQALGGLAQRIEIDTFAPELGALFLLRRATIITASSTTKDAVQNDHEIAVQISKELGGLPLALDQAGAYVEETRCDLATYLELYRTRRATLLSRRGKIHDYPASVATTWSLSFEKVEARSLIAAELLRFCAFLHPDAIPEEIVTIGASYFVSASVQVEKPTLLKRALLWLRKRVGEVESNPPSQCEVKDTFVLNEFICILRSYSLVRRNTIKKTLSIHRLVQAVLRDMMTGSEVKLWTERTVRAVSETCPVVEFAMWPQWERCLPHALVCAELVEQEDLMLVEAAHLLNNTGIYLYEHGRYGESEPLYLRALSIRERQLGPDHPDIATSLNNLAELYSYQGKYSEAEFLYMRALQITERRLGADHPNTARVLNNLAGLYKSQGKYSEAEFLYMRALQITEQQLGANHSDTARVLNNLAVLYDKQGRYDQVEPLCQRALAIREQELGPQHPHMAVSLGTLAQCYIEQSKYTEAKPLLQRAIAIFEQQLGTQHPHTATCVDDLATLYKKQGQYDKAKPLYQRALVTCEQALGSLHPRTATSLNNLAGLYYAQGQYDKAEPLYRRVLVILEQSLGSEHPNTKTTRQNYVTLLRAMNHDEEAEQIEREHDS